MNKAQEILEGLRKLLFEDTPPPAATTDYTLEDGVTIVSISALEVGGQVKIGDAPAPAGVHVLQDGTSITVDEAGIITEVKPKEEPALIDPLTPPAMDMAKEFADMKEAFGSHTQAFESYKETVNLQFGTLNQTILKQDGIIKQLFELVTELTKTPAADPLEEGKKQSAFSKSETAKSKKESILGKIKDLGNKTDA